MASRVSRGYRAITTIVREQDVAEAKRIADLLRTEGWSRADRSLVIRAALVFLSDAVQGKPPEEIMRYFMDRRARRSQTKAAPPAVPTGAKA